MKVSVLSGSNWEAKLDHATRGLSLRSHFEHRHYGTGLLGIVILLNCREPELNHKQRVHFTRSTRTLYLDVMLDLDEMTKLDHTGRRQAIAKRLLAEVVRIITSRGFKEFDATAFTNDLRLAIEAQLLGADADRFDHLCKPRATC